MRLFWREREALVLFSLCLSLSHFLSMVSFVLYCTLSQASRADSLPRTELDFPGSFFTRPLLYRAVSLFASSSSSSFPSLAYVLYFFQTLT